jgi:hypothetical protein
MVPYSNFELPPKNGDAMVTIGNGKSLLCACIRLILEPLAPFHGDNRGSNPLGDATTSPQLGPIWFCASKIGHRYGDAMRSLHERHCGM